MTKRVIEEEQSIMGTIFFIFKVNTVEKVLIVEQISGAIFQGGGLRSTTFVSIYQNVRIGL